MVSHQLPTPPCPSEGNTVFPPRPRRRLYRPLHLLHTEAGDVQGDMLFGPAESLLVVTCRPVEAIASWLMLRPVGIRGASSPAGDVDCSASVLQSEPLVRSGIPIEPLDVVEIAEVAVASGTTPLCCCFLAMEDALLSSNC